jgi:hypothetical protein
MFDLSPNSLARAVPGSSKPVARSQCIADFARGEGMAFRAVMRARIIEQGLPVGGLVESGEEIDHR